VSTLDLLPTFCALSGAELPKDRTLDGYDVSEALKGRKGPRNEMFYYRSYDLMAVRLGPWKAHFQTQAGYGQPQAEKHDPPLLFNLEVDPGESYNVAEKNPQVLAEIKTLVEKHRAGMKTAESQVDL
jgi:arylsulfatase A